MDSDPLKEYIALKNEINFHNYRYHVLDNPVISDYEFDQLLIKLRRIEEIHPGWITADSPTQRGGSTPAEQFDKVIHPKHILSLANAFSEDDLKKWFDRIIKIDERVRNAEFVLEPKIDGLTVVLHYRDGVLIKGATRGNGEIGEDITQNIRTIKSVPLKIPVHGTSLKVPETLVVRAEAYINTRDFAKLNKRFSQKGERTYQNPRNTAAGSLRLLNPAVVATRPLRILAYAIVAGNPKLTQWETLEYLKTLGFPVSDILMKCHDFNEVLSCIRKWPAYRDTIGYEIDGVVIKLDNLRTVEDLGFVGKDPRGAIALKFPAQEVTTKLLDIGVNVGRTGVLTPFAILEPVEIGGAVIKRATLHNFDFIREKDIRIGDRVLIKRAGEVIPYVIGPILPVRTGEEKKFKPPDVCPVCGMPVESVEDEVAWYCVNNACPAQLIRNIEHFVSRVGMDIVGLGIKIVEKLVSKGLIKDVADLYALRKADLLNLEGFAEKKADKIILAISESKNRPLVNLITALGIHGIGEVSAEKLAFHYSNLEELSKAKKTEIEKIESIGPSTAEAIVAWFSLKKNIEVINKLHAYGVWPTNIQENISHEKTLEGLKFVVTGTLTDFTRDEIKKYIKQFGGKVSDSISDKVDYLVLGENPGSKLEKAKRIGVKVISEGELKEMAGIRE
ncbi:MAG: NAD-dependent DNA ligase LigA [Anaerolineaceae bacterium]|nr:NAD-dependent DNA ligase LigA [Anaerolineaceae bacterium]